MNELLKRRNDSAVFLTLLVFTAIIYAGALLWRYQPYTYLYYDPGWSAETTRSLLEDADLDLRNQLSFDPQAAGDQTALGVRGEWYPLHEILLPLVSIPFYAVFGVNGFLLCNYLIGLMLVAGCYQTAARFSDPKPAFFAALATGLSPVTIEYVYSFSIDLFGAALLIWAFDFAVGRMWFRCGLAFGAAVFARIINMFAAPAFLAAALLCRIKTEGIGGSRFNCLLRLAAGGMPFAVALLAANQHMFGGPLEFSYRHWIFPGSGSLNPVDQTKMFELNLFSNGWRALFDGRSGLFAGSPFAALAIVFGLGPLFRRNRPAFHLVCGISLCLLIGVATYNRPFPGAPGNRYLLGITAVSTLPLALCFQRLAGVFDGSKLLKGSKDRA